MSDPAKPVRPRFWPMMLARVGLIVAFSLGMLYEWLVQPGESGSSRTTSTHAAPFLIGIIAVLIDGAWAIAREVRRRMKS
jgi:hypothetical protein